MKLKFFWSIIVIILVPTVISVSTDPTTTITTAPSSATDTALETSAPPTSSSSLSTSSANRYATLNSINAYLQQKFGRSDTLSLRQSTPLKFNPLWTINDVKIDYSKVLGKSSSGTTVFLGYLRRNPSFKVAVKEFDLKQLIQRSGLSTNDALQYLSKETGVGIGSHPNILKVSKGLSRDGSKVYVFSEFCAKGDLVDLINSSRRSTDKAEFKKRIQCVFWQQIAMNPEFSFEFDSDIKPDNVFIDGNGLAKIADFGLSQKVGSQENGGVLDESQTFGGTWEYLPPDFVDAFSFRKFAKAHPEAPHKYWRPKAMDVWAAGILLYSAMTGRIPPWEMANWSQDLEFYHFEKSGGHYFDHLVNEGVLDQNELRMLNRMLNANPLRRITAPQILQDPWFQSLQNTCPPLIVEEVLSAETV